MRVVLATTIPYFAKYGGAIGLNLRLLKALAKRQHEVIAVLPGAGNMARLTRDEQLTALRERGVHVTESTTVDSFVEHGVNVKCALSAPALPHALAQVIEETEPTIVLVSSEDPGAQLLEAALHASSGPVVHLVHTATALPYGPLSHFPAPARSARLMPRVHSALTFSRWAADYVHRWSGLAARVVPPLFAPAPWPRLDREGGTFITMVNPSAIKGLEVFLEIARAMPDQQFAAVPTWATTADDRAKLAAAPDVTLLPPSGNFEDILRKTKVLLVPSLWHETFGLVAVEAMLRGVPVVASDVAGLREAALETAHLVPVQPIQSYGDALDDRMMPIAHVPRQSVGPWVDALRSLIDDPVAHARASDQAAERARAYVAREPIARWEEALEEIAHRDRPARAQVSRAWHQAQRALLFGETDTVSPEGLATIMGATEGRPATEAAPRGSTGSSLRVLFATQLAYFPKLGGAHRCNRLLLEALAARGHRVTAMALGRGTSSRFPIEEQRARLRDQGVAVSTDPDGTDRFELHGVSVHAASNMGRLASRLQEQLSANVYDVVIVSEDPSHVLLAPAVRAAPGRVVYVVHSPVATTWGPSAWFPNRHRTRFVRGVGKLVTVSRATAAYLERWLDMPAEVLRFPVYGSPPFARCGDPQRGHVTLINPSRIKGLSIFLSLAKAMPTVSFAAVPSWATTDSDRERLSSTENVVLLSASPNIDDIFAQTRILVVPSMWHEAFGLVVVEAMLRGVPVVASDSGGLPEAKLDIPTIVPTPSIESFGAALDSAGVPEVDTPDHDIEGWRRAVTALIEDPDHYRRVADAGRAAAEKFVEGLGWESWEQALLEVAQRPLEHRGAMFPEMPVAWMQTSPRDRLPFASELPTAPSLPQEAALLAERLGIAGTVCAHARVGGGLSSERLRNTLQTLTDDHDVLRMSIDETSGIREAVGDLVMSDIRTERVRADAIDAVLREESLLPVDPGRPPLLRLRVFELAPDDHVLSLVCHPIVADGWTARALLAELAHPELAVHARGPRYVDYATWLLRETHRLVDVHLPFWETLVAGTSDASLPTDAPRPNPLPPWCDVFEVALRPAVVTSMRRHTSDSEEIYDTFLTVFGQLVAQLSDNPSLLVGTPSAHRSTENLRALIGPTATHHMHRVDFLPGATFRKARARIAEARQQASAHDAVRFESIVYKLRPSRQLTRNPLFQVGFGRRSPTPATNSSVELLSETVVSQPHELGLFFRDDGDGIVLFWESNRALFTSATVERFRSRFDALLARALDQPDAPLVDTPVMGSTIVDETAPVPPKASSAQPSDVADAILEMWRSRFGRDVGRDADFFQLGGHSLSAVDLVADIQRRFAVQLPVTFVFDHSRAGDMIEAVARLRATSAPEQTASHALVPAPNAPTVALPKGDAQDTAPFVFVHDRILASARAHPDSVAVLDEEQSLRYGDLLRSVARTVMALKSLGVRRGDRVVIALDREPAMVVGILATMVLGACYVPVSLEDPRERAQQLIDRCKAAAILCHPDYEPGANHPRTFPAIDASADVDLASVDLRPDDAAYGIYTSGSTGEPKCAVNTHRGLANRIAWMQRELRLAANDRVLHKTPLTFDVSVWELLWPLTQGATLVLARPAGHRDPWYLTEAIRRFGVTTCHFVPSMLELFMTHGDLASCDSLRTVICSGEALRPDHCQRFFAASDADLYNLYGPTEASIDVTWWRCRRYDRRAFVPIGRPIDGIVTHVLDANLDRVGAEQEGELYLGGVGLARGYLNDPRRTASAFVPNPFGAPGERLYRTGDRASWLPDESLQYLGRRDHQLKLRGVRVELGEIEAGLLAIPAVRDAVVFKRSSEEALVAVVVCEGETTSADLRAHLLNRLPRGLIPNHIHIANALPRLSNGKIDRATIRLRHDGEATTVAVESPRTATASETRPVSAAARGLWVRQQLDTESPALHITTNLRLRGPLNAGRLERAIRRVLSDTPSLRVTFHQRGDEVVQRQHDEDFADVVMLDGTDVRSSDRDRTFDELAHDTWSRPFELTTEPPIRVRIMRFGDDDHALALCAHHIVWDGISASLFFDHVAAGHDDVSDTRRTPSRNTPSDAVTASEAASHWQRALSGAPPLTHVPGDRARGSASGEGSSFDKGSAVQLVLDEEVAESLLTVGRTEGCTPFMTFFAAFALLTARTSGRRDIIVGTPVDTRHLQHAVGEIGVFVNMLPLRLRVDPTMTFRDLLHATRQSIIDAMQHASLPFERIVEKVAPVRSTAHDPLVQVVCSVQSERRLPELAGVICEEVRRPIATTVHELFLLLRRVGDRWLGELEYATSRFDASTVEGLCALYERILDEVAHAPDQALSDHERWLATGPRVRSDAVGELAPHLDTLLAARVAAQGDTVAIDDGSDRTTFAELARASSNIATALQQMGVQSGDLVAITSSVPSARMASWGAALTLGATLWPVERDVSPSAVSEVHPTIWLTDNPIEDAMGVRTTTITPLLQDTDRSAPTRGPETASIRRNVTTGANAIVCSSPRAVLRYAATQGALAAAIAQVCNIAALGPGAFVASAIEATPHAWWIHAAVLASGAKLQVIPSDALATAETLAQWLREASIDTLFADPFVWSGLARQLPTRQPTDRGGLRGICVDGPLGIHVEQQLRDRLNDLRVMWTSPEHAGFVLESATSEPHDHPGQVTPAPGVRCEVVDDYGRRLPPGVRGRLHLSTPSPLTPFGRPDTNGAASSSPHASTMTAYRRSNGALVLTHDNDHLVTVRGRPIALRAAEAIVGDATGVSDAFCCMIDERFTAFVVPTAPEKSALLKTMRLTPPTAVHPDRVVVVASLQRHRAGRPADTAAFMPIGDAHTASDISKQAKRVASAYESVLGLDQIHAEDDFFALGGHSMAAIRIINELRRHFDVDLPVRAIFDHPGVAALATHIDTLLFARKNPHGTESVDASGAPLRRHPLSAAQQRLFFLQLLAPQTPLFNMHVAKELTGALDHRAWERALRGLAADNAILRTRYGQEGAELFQQTDPTWHGSLEIVPVTSSAAARRLLDDARQQPLPLEGTPPWRARLFRIDANKHLFLLSVHHVSADGWSLHIAWEQLVERYLAARADHDIERGTERESSGKEPYAAYAFEQRRQLGGGSLGDDLSYWRTALADAPTTVELPADGERGHSWVRDGQTLSRDLDPRLTQAIRSFAKSNGCTVFMVLFTAFAVVLHRLSGQDDVVIGVPVAGRDDPRWENTLGNFLNTLAIRARFANGATFEEALALVRARLVDAMHHQRLPFESLLEELDVSRTVSRSPLTPILFNMIGADEDTNRFDGVEAKDILSVSNAAAQDLELYARQRSEHIELAANFATDLFSEERIDELLSQLELVLDAACANATLPLASISLLSTRLAARLAAPQVDSSLQESVVVMLQRRFDDAPESDAISWAGTTHSTRDLQRAVANIRAELTRLEVAQGDVVGIIGRHGFDTVAAMVAVLHHGGVLFLVDRDLPDDRRREILERARASAVIQTAEHADLPMGMKVVDALRLPTEEVCDPPAVRRPDDPAYLVFTSGSTGEPTAVLGTHRGLAHFVHWQGSTFAFGANDKTAHVTSLSFDVVLREVFTTLCFGGSLCIPPPEHRGRGEALFEFMRHHGVTVLHTVPSVFAFWTQPIDSITVPSLSRVFFAGEPLSHAVVQRVRDLAPGVNVLNLYGPTETTLAKFCWQLDDDTDAMIPVGRPLPGTNVTVVNSAGMPAGTGELGEVVIATEARALVVEPGRWSLETMLQDERARERARKKPHATGDMGRWRPDGVLELLGRKDDQVKIRGVRVEPNEVARELARHPDVTRALVLPIGRGPLRKLVAFCTSRSEPVRLVSELRRIARRQLPDAFVPTEVYVLDALPMLPNGKPDRQALIARHTAAPPIADASDALPDQTLDLTSDTERRVWRIWSETLGTSALSPEDDFFDAGGHSLLALQVLSRLRQEMGVELPLITFFQAPTVREMATLVAERLEKDT